MTVTVMNEDDDLFASGADVLVNPVNAVGTMGKGLALLFRDRFPANNRAYQAACRSGEMRAGGVFMGPGQPGSARWVANLATKDHWRKPSQLEWVESGIQALRQWVDEHPEHQIRSIACPALGSGLGGLDWRQVAPVIERAFADSSVDLKLYPPKGAPAAKRSFTPAVNSAVSSGVAPGHRPDRQLQEVLVRIGDIIPHETPKASVVQSMLRHLKSGGQLEPIEIDWRWEKHWTQGPREMECTGTGYGMIDGHHRWAALKLFHGVNAVITAKAKQQLAQTEAADGAKKATIVAGEATQKALFGSDATSELHGDESTAEDKPKRALGFRRMSRP